MSHNIEIWRDGSGSFVSARKNAWHLLGTVKKDGYLSLDEMLSVPRADYEVFSLPARSILEVGGVVVDEAVNPSKKHTCRIHPDTGKLQILGTVGTEYTIIQNRDAFRFGQVLLNTQKAVGETAGVLDDGRRAFCSFRLPQVINVGGVDPVIQYLVIYTGHDGTVAYTAMDTMIRVVCQNTMNMALRGASHKWKLSHTKHAKLDEEKARKVLGLSAAYQEEFTRTAEALVNTRLTNQMFEEIITANWGPEDNASKNAQTRWDDKRDQLMRLFKTADTQANIRGTAWAGYNAIVEYADWGTPVRNTATVDVERAQFARSLDGGVDDVKATALRAFLAVAR